MYKLIWQFLRVNCASQNPLSIHVPTLLCLEQSDQPPNEDEIAVAQGHKMMDPKVESKWLQKLEKSLMVCSPTKLIEPLYVPCCLCLMNYALIFVWQDKAWSQDEFEGSLLNGWLHVINPLRRLTRLNFNSYLSTLTFAQCFIFLTVKQWRHKSWRWGRILFKAWRIL